jgi:hypothetical protein
VRARPGRLEQQNGKRFLCGLSPEERARVAAVAPRPMRAMRLPVCSHLGMGIRPLFASCLLGREPRMKSWHRLIEHSNPYRWVLLVDPIRAYLLGLVTGILLAAASWLLSAAKFAVALRIYSGGLDLPRKVILDLGYVTQLNYGPWYILGCPLVLYFASLTAYFTRRLGPPQFRRVSSIPALATAPHVSLLGIALFAAFAWKNVYAELRDYRTLALGWVQAEQAAAWSTQLLATQKPVDITQSRFTYLDLPPPDSKSPALHIHPGRILVDSVIPGTHSVKSHPVFLGFVGVAKLWVGYWEGLAVYIALLALFWGVALLPELRRDTILALREAEAALWAERPFCTLLYLGVLINLFWIARFLANAAKGTFGSIDQWISLTTLAPGMVTASIIALVFHRTYRVAPDLVRSPISKRGYTALGFWALSFVTLVSLLLNYSDPAVYTVLHQFLCLLPVKVCPVLQP